MGLRCCFIGAWNDSLACARRTDKHPARSWVNQKLGRLGSSKERVVVLTGIHPSPCTTPFGDFFMSLQVSMSRCHSSTVGT
jgi:hypothetical protein